MFIVQYQKSDERIIDAGAEHIDQVHLRKNGSYTLLPSSWTLTETVIIFLKGSQSMNNRKGGVERVSRNFLQKLFQGAY